MNTRTFLLSVASFGLLVVAARRTRAAEAADPRLVAELIWGTNGDTPPEKELKPVSADLDKRLRRVFKWRRYFLIQKKEFEVIGSKPTQVEMSKECRLELAQVGNGEYLIQLIGRGVLVVKKRQRIQPGETVVLGGDDKEDDAWFVVLGFAKPKDEKK